MALDKFLECKHAKRNHCQRSDYKRHRGCAELVVQGKVIEEELVYEREVFSPCHDNREDCSSKQPPLFASLHKEESQHKEEADDSAHIYRSRCKGLRSPVGRQMLHEAASLCCAVVTADEAVGLRVLADVVVRACTVEVGHKQRECLAYAVAPLVGIVYLKSRALLALLLEHRAAAHRLLGIVGRGDKLSYGGDYREDGCNSKHACSLEVLLELALLNSIHKVDYCEDKQRKQQIVAYLLVRPVDV